MQALCWNLIIEIRGSFKINMRICKIMTLFIFSQEKIEWPILLIFINIQIENYL